MPGVSSSARSGEASKGMTAALPIPARPKEMTLIEWYQGVELAAIMQHVHAEKLNCQVTVHVSQGSPTMVEVRQKINQHLTSS